MHILVYENVQVLLGIRMCFIFVSSLKREEGTKRTLQTPHRGGWPSLTGNVVQDVWRWLLTLYLQSHHVACCRRLASCIHCVSAARKKVLSSTMLLLCTNSYQQEWRAVNDFQTFVVQNSNIFFMLWGLVEASFWLSGHKASYVWATANHQGIHVESYPQKVGVPYALLPI